MPITLSPPATAADFAALAAMARDLAVFHGDDFHPPADTLQRDHGIWYRAVLARTAQGEVVGFAAWFPFYHAQNAERNLELQTLFVAPASRSHGIGERLVAHVAAEAVRLDCACLRIGVRKANIRAAAFYRRIGCRLLDRGDTWACRLDGEALQRLAG